MRGSNTTRRTKKHKNMSRKTIKNISRNDPTILFDRWHMDPVPSKAELTPTQEEFVKNLLAKIEYENSPEGREAMRKAYFEKRRNERTPSKEA